MTTKMYITKLVGAFLFVFGIFFLLLSVTNIFNDVDFINEYKTCVDIARYDPGILDSCKSNVSSGLDIVIRGSQTHLTTGQYLKIYVTQIIEVLFSVLLIIIGDFIYLSNNHRYYKTHKVEAKTEEKPKKKTTKTKKKTSKRKK